MSEYLREALKRKRKRKINWDELEEQGHVQKDQSVSPGKINDVDCEEMDDDSGQIAAAKKTELITQGDDTIEKQAMEVLGRKPMSNTRKKKDDDDDYFEDFETRPEVLAEMEDERLIESLKSGRRKPKGLWDKVQLNIARRRK